MNGLVLHISAGQGPAECEWVVARLVSAFVAEAAVLGLDCAPIEPVAGPVASALLHVDGDAAGAFAAVRAGTVRWIGPSPFRLNHKRRNWFVAVSRIDAGSDLPDPRDADIRYQAFRASGPGGQHVTKTDSAVRATHLPTGLVATSQDQRSQHANRRIARLKLLLLLDTQKQRTVTEERRAAWNRNQQVERGNPVRTYNGVEFRLS